MNFAATYPRRVPATIGGLEVRELTDRRREGLDRAREALTSHAWTDAYAALDTVPDPADDPEYLELLGEAAWWLGRLDECIGARERLYRVCEHADRRRAARAAVLLYDNHSFKGRRAVANAWVARARRLLDGHQLGETEQFCVPSDALLHVANSEGEVVHADDLSHGTPSLPVRWRG